MSLFWYGYSKNIIKLKKINYYIDSNEIDELTEIWNTINFDILIKNIYNNNINKLKELLNYSFLEITDNLNKFL